MPESPSDSSLLCAVTLQALMGFGALQEVIICAGARNCALVVAFASAPGIRVWHHFEERAAAFFALGRILSHGRPVAVITTSGTAVAELFPAIIEAHYQGLPLVALTADRPAAYRGTGAPQAIEQAGIFGNYPALSLDVRELDDLAPLAEWTRLGPLHVNLCLEEPGPGQLGWLRNYGAGLTPNDGREDDDQENGSKERSLQDLKTTLSLPAALDRSTGVPPVSFHHPKSPARQRVIQEAILTLSLPALLRPLVLLGDLLPGELPAVTAFLKHLAAPVYAEAASGLRGHPELRSLLISGGDTALKSIPHDSVLRLGGVPACRFWRDLEDRPHVPVLSLTRSGHRGLARESSAFPLLPEILESLTASLNNTTVSVPGSATTSSPNHHRPHIPDLQPALDACLARHPGSEPALVRALSDLIPPGAVVFTGNSMPIREWNLCARPDRPHHARALRGANGIDGNLSAFLGLAVDAAEAWCLIGDLTALYDLAAPWILPQFDCPKLRIVVIQNAGGKIFSRLPALRGLTETERRLMENPHQISLKGWAEQWGLSHHTHHGPLTTLPPLPDRLVLELHPDPEATEAFWRDWSTAARQIP
ncbi:MAG: 2-succinyl-5-enolpyruvyl-6-hydroxy-3-cyclohexene-1-carboxylic-acid synthase [Verrucomicrobiota bacterium]